MLIIDKKSIQEIPAPDKLFVMFIDTGLYPYPCVHKRIEGKAVHYSIVHRFEGCAILSDAEVNQLTKRYPKTNWKVITLADIATELPVYINFPAGHPLHNNNIEVRAVNGSLDFRDILKPQK
jgi:hypothetical protein